MKYVLSLDGGGIRGIVPALVLAELERRHNKPIADMFDLVAGTSTGGILALGALCDDGAGKAKYTAEALSRIYIDHGKEIFARSFWGDVSTVSGLSDALYSEKGLERICEQNFGYTPLGAALKPALVTSYDIHNREPFFFKSWREMHASVAMKDVARATSAAPTYFDPALVAIGGAMKALVDGGVFINNPALSAYVEAQKLFPGEAIKVVSIGTGEMMRPINYEEAKNWGKVGWVAPLISCVFDGVSDAVNYQMKQLLGDNYVRLQTSLSLASDDMDDVSDRNIDLLIQEAAKLITTNGSKMDQIFS